MPGRATAKEIPPCFVAIHPSIIRPAAICSPRLGVDRRTVHEIAEDERAIRCPHQGAVYPEYGFASLFPEPAFGMALQDAAPAEPWDPASSLPPAD